jgi:hypothetical protein
MLLQPIHLFSVNVWVGIVGDFLAAVHVLPHQLTGSHYRDLPKLQDNILLAIGA